MNERCLKFRSNLQNVSVDESMQPYFGRNSSKQRVPNQSIPVGYKMWVLADETGYVLKFDPIKIRKRVAFNGREFEGNVKFGRKKQFSIY